MHVTLSADPFEVGLPKGEYTLVAERGKEYLPTTVRVRVADEPVDVELALTRWIDLASRGWYSGDTHVHRSLEELPNVMLAEDLNAAFPLVDWVREAFQSPLSKRDPSGIYPGPRPISVDSTHVIFPSNTEYEIFSVGGQSHTLGAFFVLNHQAPLDLGVPPVAPVADEARRQGALIELDKHNWPWSMILVPVMKVDLYELANNHCWRTRFGFPAFGEAAADHMQVERDEAGFTERGWIDFTLQNYFLLLNCGFRLRPTAGTASGVHPVPLGYGRVYVHLPGGFSAQAWLAGLNAGRSFVTTGPMLFATVNDQQPGHTFQVPATGGEYRLAGTVESAEPIEAIEIVVNGKVLRRVPASNESRKPAALRSAWDETIRVETSSWIAVRAFTKQDGQKLRYAHSGPFFFEVPGKPLRPARKEVDYLVTRAETQLARSGGLLPPEAVKEYEQALHVFRGLANGAR
jgi:hypothetical protein